MKPVLTFIAALDENGLIGDEHGIPWRLPRDVAHFREHTHGKWILVGRTTYEEMRGWYREGDTPLVLTSQCGWDPETGRVVSSVPHALALAESAAQAEVVCIGGGQTFAAALPYADRMILTRVHHAFPAAEDAAYFPPWDASAWREVRTENFAHDDEHAQSFTIQWWEKR
jgi:dihydrofolate reductase